MADNTETELYATCAEILGEQPWYADKRWYDAYLAIVDEANQIASENIRQRRWWPRRRCRKWPLHHGHRLRGRPTPQLG